MRSTGSLLAAIVAVGALLAPVANAQSGTYLKVDVPFEFAVSGKTLPAGVYTVRDASHIVGFGVLQPASPGGQAVHFRHWSVAPKDGRYATRTQVVFNRYGNQYFLTQVWQAGHASGKQLPKSKLERETEKVAAVRETVILVAQR